MKKILIFSFSLIFALLAVSCASKNKKTDSEVVVTSGEEVEQIVSFDGSEAADKKSGKKNSKDKNNKQKATKSNISVEYGIINLKSKPKLGTFNIGVVNQDGKLIPALSSANESSGNAFYLKYGKKIYKLNSSMDVSSSASIISGGMQIKYSVNNTADVTVDFTCQKSSREADYDIVKIVSTVTNKGNKNTDIGLKCVLDTVLGETKGNHFYSSAHTPIKSEVLYRSVKNERWILSSNDEAGMQILLYGADISTPDLVALGNKSTLSSMNWEPNISSTRAFDTVLSYNDSCMGILWPSVFVPSGTSKSFVFYIAFSNTGLIPAGEKLIGSGVATETKVEKKVNDVVYIEDPMKDISVSDVVTIDDSFIRQNVQPVQIQPDYTYTQPKPAVNVSEEQLSPEYVQNLIDRITALESEENMDTDELQKLNSEMDAILEVLRR